jgi:chromosomal replication initiator protein
MNAAPPFQPTETAMEANRRRVAFRAWVAVKAAALEQRKSVLPRMTAPVSLPIKEAWFSIECASAARTLKVGEIQKLVCERYGLTQAQLLAQRRSRPLVRKRQIAMYLCKELTGKSLPAIGRRFGRKDHTTVLHGARRIAALIDPSNRQFDAEIAAAVKALRDELETRLG